MSWCSCSLHQQITDRERGENPDRLTREGAKGMFCQRNEAQRQRYRGENGILERITLSMSQVLHIVLCITSTDVEVH